VSDDTIRRRFLGSLDEAAASAWVAQAAQPLWAALPERLILDWDSTVQTKYGQQQGAEVGYNPTKRGRKSFHPLLAVAALPLQTQSQRQSQTAPWPGGNSSRKAMSGLDAGWR